MKIKLLIVCSIVLFSMINVTNAAEVDPIQSSYGNIFPELADQTLEVFRSTDISGPWYVRFELLSPADVIVGAHAFTSTSGRFCCFNITSIRLVTIDGKNVAFGTDIITDESFSGPIDHLVIANNLAVGQYAIEVSGSGNRRHQALSGVITEVTDFITHISVTSPSTDTEYEQGRKFGRQECIDDPADCGISVTGEATLTEDLKMNIPILNWSTQNPTVLWADLEYVPNDILFKVTDYGFITKEEK